MGETANELTCDGCGQVASHEHIAKRLQRLAWTTRFRPIHINTVLLGAVAPASDAAFFYSPEGAFADEARLLAEVADSMKGDPPKEQLQIAFQRQGFFAAHVLECSFEADGGSSLADLLTKGLASAITRI